MELVKLLSKVKQDEAREKLIAGAWIAFQIRAEANKTFGQYLEELGLIEGRGETVKTKPITAKEAIEKAEQILAMARKKK